MTQSRRTPKENTDDLFDEIRQPHEDMQEIQRLLALEIDWTHTRKVDIRLQTPLQYATYCKRWETAKAIMQRIQQTYQPSSSADDIQLGGAILRLVDANQTELVRLFLTSELSKKVHKPTVIGWTFTNSPCDHAPHAAIRHGNEVVLKRLLDYGYPLDARCAEGTPAELARKLKASGYIKAGCLVEIARHTQLDPSYLADVSGQRLLNMMLENISPAAPGYQHEKIQDKRGKVLEKLLALPENKRLAALIVAKNKRSLLGDYLLNYKQGFFSGFFNSSNSAEEMEKRIDVELAILTPKPPAPRNSTADVYDELGFEDTEKEAAYGDVELADRSSAEEESSFDSISLSEEKETNSSAPTPQPKR